ncbi:MAG: pyrroloquinoline quinone biosynthesis peptide chaperone PqqD [Betaproteobacteria bacterium]|nr:pyrroloquinoline quinone biosynthesis peptide chaperone PqqD [Betaproteobacteria bacterium]
MTTQIQLSDVFSIGLHHRFQWEDAQQNYVILFPEGMVKLHGSAGEILKRIDGKVSVGEIVEDLKTTFPDAEDIESDIMGMLELALSKGWLRKV